MTPGSAIVATTRASRLYRRGRGWCAGHGRQGHREGEPQQAHLWPGRIGFADGLPGNARTGRRGRGRPRGRGPLARQQLQSGPPRIEAPPIRGCPCVRLDGRSRTSHTQGKRRAVPRRWRRGAPGPARPGRPGASTSRSGAAWISISAPSGSCTYNECVACAGPKLAMPRSANRSRIAANCSCSTEIATWCMPPIDSRVGGIGYYRKVEKCQHVPVADVEEEVRRAGQVPVLKQLHERKAKDLRVELIVRSMSEQISARWCTPGHWSPAVRRRAPGRYARKAARRAS